MFSKELKDILCRTCLTALCQKQPIFGRYHLFNTKDLAKKLMLCSGLQVESTDLYPQQVCLECFNKILQFYEFQQMCCRSLEKFKELLQEPGKVRQENVLGANEENEPVKVNVEIALGKIELQEAPISIETANACGLLNSTVKKKRGRPPKRTPKESKTKLSRSCYIKKTQAETTDCEDGTMKISENKCKNENEFEVMLEVEIISENTNLEKDEKVLEENAAENIISNVKLKPDILEEMSLSESDSDSKSAQRRIYKCDRCEDSFYALHRLGAHKRQHDGLPAYACTLAGCERTFNRWHYYKEHQKDHKGTNEFYQCDLDNCERVYKNKSALNIHKRKYHHQGPELKTHMCEICGKVLKSSAVLNEHRYIHIDRTQLPYACEEPDCMKRFSNKEKLKIHKMRHAGIKNFICPYCGMRKTTRNELKIHINYHTLERTWPCRFCSKVCNSAGNLKMHVKNMHEGAKDFACRFCDRTFAKADTKKYHEMTHTGEKPHECQECGKRFVQPAALRTHRKVHLRQKSKILKEGNSEVRNVKVIDNAEPMVGDTLNEGNRNVE